MKCAYTGQGIGAILTSSIGQDALIGYHRVLRHPPVPMFHTHQKRQAKYATNHLRLSPGATSRLLYSVRIAYKTKGGLRMIEVKNDLEMCASIMIVP